MADTQLPRIRSKDIAGQRFGRLLAIEPVPGTTSPVKWRCRCDCGKETQSSGTHLRGGRTRSCGCAWTARHIRKPRGDYIDLTGRVFGMLTVIRRGGSKPVKWFCQCECGNETVTHGASLRKGKTRSCGCLIGATARATFRKHGRSSTQVYRAWTGMIERCSNPNFRQWDSYGGRGITICDRWRERFENFLADIGEPPSPDHSLDRINNDGNYEPGNCRWATRVEQSANRRKVARIECFTTDELLAELARRRIPIDGQSLETACEPVARNSSK